jgi:hypothetical protein
MASTKIANEKGTENNALARKNMQTVFWNAQCCILVEFLLQAKPPVVTVTFRRCKVV